MSTTPSVTFNRYTEDGVEVDISSLVYTINSGTMSGAYENEDKYIYGFAVSPLETTTVNPVVHELVFDITPNAGVELSTMSPIAGGSGTNQRFVNVTSEVVDVTPWGIGTTSGVMTIDTTGGETGAIEHFNSGVLNSGATWTAPYGSSGTAHMDVPTLYNGSFVALNDATAFAWDGAQFLHDFQIISAQVGHHVKLTAMSGITSGSVHDDNIDLYKTGEGIAINVKTYHEVPESWRLFDPDGIVTQSGAQSWTLNQWAYIDNLDLLDPALNETWQLKLYGSGSIQYPTPLRTISINIYIVEPSTALFGLARFGLARFGLSGTV